MSVNIASAVARQPMLIPLSDGVLVAIIGLISGMAVALIGAVAKNRSDAERLKADVAHQKAMALDAQSKAIRESLAARLQVLEERADAQWDEIVKLTNERALDIHARIVLLDILLGYPNPPGAPPIPPNVAKAIGYEPYTDK